MVLLPAKWRSGLALRLCGWSLVVAALFIAPVWAMRGGDDGPALGAFLALQRRIFPGAVVSGRFYDWRTVSKYRAQAGLHFGYDIAMPAGTRVVTAWPGQVTAVAAWYGSEHGITLMSPSGYAITFGHLLPRVRAGDVLNAGDVVGEVVIDHVDIKMRGPDGAYFDFGHDSPAAGPAPLPAAPYTEQQLIASHADAWVRTELVKERRALETASASAQEARAQFEDGVLSRVEAQEVGALARAAELRVQWLERVARRLRTDPLLRRARAVSTARLPTDSRAVRRALERLVPPPRSSPAGVTERLQ